MNEKPNINILYDTKKKIEEKMNKINLIIL